jgi:hypothetical protein
MASLRDLQRSFAAALRDPAAACAVAPAANLGIYRNNSRTVFRGALERAFPVVRRRVGDDYFRLLGAHYRAAHPSRSGDLHWVGRAFPDFLAGHLAGGEYAWLADLARLEWSREESAIAQDRLPVDAGLLATFTPEQLEHLRFGLQPSLRLVSSPFPVFSVWTANQVDEAPPVDQSLGAEYMMVRQRLESVEVQALAEDLFSYLYATAAGATLGEAMTAASLDEGRLTEVLGFLFGSGLVCAVEVDRAHGQRVGTSS